MRSPCLSRIRLPMPGMRWLAVCGMGVAALPASGGLIVAWDGSCGNAFWASQCGSMTNWNNDQQTTLGDQVSIGPGDPVVSIVFDAQANTLSCESGLHIGASLELAGSATIKDLTVNSIAQRALKINAGQVTLTNTSGWTQGKVGGAGVLRNEALLTGNPQLIDTVTFINANDTQLRGFNIGAGAVAINLAGATFGIGAPSLSPTMGGTGMFVNHGDFFHDHDTNSIISVQCPYLQDTGSLIVNSFGVANASSHFSNDCNFSGGQFTINGDARVRFMDPGGVGAVFTFDGLQAVTGNGNLHFEVPFFGEEVKVASDLNVNLTGTDGLVINSRYTTLGAELRNLGKCRLLSGTIREAAAEAKGMSVPQLSNEPGATIRLNGSGITLDTWLRNKAGATIIHEFQGLQLGTHGLVTNHGTYEHYRGGISGTNGSGSFANYGTYVRPNHANTMNESFQAPFVLNPGSVARFEKATTEFAFATGAGTYFLGGDMSIWENAIVRVGGGSCEQADSLITGLGQFHFGGWPGPAIIFPIDDGRVLQCNLGPDEQGDPTTGGTFLDTQSRIAGLGILRNINQMFWNGGTIGANGAGTVLNSVDGTTVLTSGLVSPGAEFVNDGFINPFDSEDGFPVPLQGLVRQIGSLSLQDGYVTNHGIWRIETQSTIAGFGVNEFLNSEIGLFQNAIPPMQQTTVTARLNNLGLVHAQSGTLGFTNVAQVSGTTLNGGRWLIDQGATLDLPGFITIFGPLTHVDCNGTMSDLSTLLINLGDLRVKGVQFGQPLTNSGTMSVNGDGGTTQVQGGNGNVSNTPTALFYANTQVVPSIAGLAAPFDLRCGNFNNSGLVAPGGPDHAGAFKLDGNYNHTTSNAALDIELGGATPIIEHDQLVVDGNVLLDGHLRVRILSGYQPTAGAQFTIITAANGTVAGTFDIIDGYGQYSLAYSPTSVTLTLIAPPHAGDTNNDGVTNVDDLINVILQWGMCPAAPTFCSADLSGDGAVDVDDLIAVILGWG